MNEHTENKTKSTTGCKFCRALNDGLCANYCLLSSAEKKALLQRIKIKNV